MDLGHRLKLFRIAADLKQGELAERLNVTTNYVYMIESGRREASQSYLKKFAKTLQLPLSVIFLETKGKKANQFTQKLLALLAEFADANGVKVE